MGALMENSSADSVDMIERARTGDSEALNSLLNRYRNRLRRMVEKSPGHPPAGTHQRIGRGPGGLRRGRRASGRVRWRLCGRSLASRGGIRPVRQPFDSGRPLRRCIFHTETCAFINGRG